MDQISKKARLDAISETQLIGFDITNNCSKDNVLKYLNKEKLKYLRVNKYNKEIDILDLSNFLMLEELIIISSKTINTEQLLNIPSLKSLEILDSKNMIPETLKYKLKSLDLERISIEYA